MQVIGLGKSLENITIDKNIKRESRDDNNSENGLEISFDEKNILESQQETLLKVLLYFSAKNVRKYLNKNVYWQDIFNLNIKE